MLCRAFYRLSRKENNIRSILRHCSIKTAASSSQPVQDSTDDDSPMDSSAQNLVGKYEFTEFELERYGVDLEIQNDADLLQQNVLDRASRCLPTNRHEYIPPDDATLRSIIVKHYSTAYNKEIGAGTNWESIDLNNPCLQKNEVEAKSKTDAQVLCDDRFSPFMRLLSGLEHEGLERAVPGSVLAELRTLADVHRLFSIPVFVQTTWLHRFKDITDQARQRQHHRKQLSESALESVGSDSGNSENSDESLSDHLPTNICVLPNVEQVELLDENQMTYLPGVDRYAFGVASQRMSTPKAAFYDDGRPQRVDDHRYPDEDDVVVRLETSKNTRDRQRLSRARSNWALYK